MCATYAGKISAVIHGLFLSQSKYGPDIPARDHANKRSVPQTAPVDSVCTKYHARNRFAPRGVEYGLNANGTLYIETIIGRKRHYIVRIRTVIMAQGLHSRIPTCSVACVNTRDYIHVFDLYGDVSVPELQVSMLGVDARRYALGEILKHMDNCTSVHKYPLGSRPITVNDIMQVWPVFIPPQ